MPLARKLEKRHQRLLKAAYVSAVLAGCAMSTASYAQDTREWQGDGPGLVNDYNNADNWTGDSTPGGDDQAVLGSIGSAPGTVDVTTSNSVDRIYFSDGANSQAFNIRIDDSSLTVNANNTFAGSGFGNGTTTGIENASGYTQTFSLENGGASLIFENNSTITNSGAGSEVALNNDAGGGIVFNDTANAGDANVFITNTGVDSNFGEISFNNSSNAGYANITNNDGGRIYFNADSDTVFSSAGNARITNNTGSETEFSYYATAGNAVIINNGGQTDFDDFTTAGNARIINNAGGWISFDDNSTAGNALIINNNDGSTDFGNSTSAGNALIINNDGGRTDFGASSTAGSATIINRSGGSTYFNNADDVNTASVINRSGGTLQIDQDVSIGHVRGAGDIILNADLTLNSTGTVNPYRNGTISGVISGPGGLIKEGANRVRLTGTNTYTGNTEVNDGILDLRGSITSDTEINSGGELRGDGDIYGNLINDGGVLRPGGTFGSSRYRELHVEENFTSTNPDSVFVSNIRGRNYDYSNNWLHVIGNAQIGGQVQLQVADGPNNIYYVNNYYTLVETEGNTLTGTFSGVTSESDLDNPSSIPDFLSLREDPANGINGGLSYTTYAAYVHLQRNTLDDLADGVNLTRNQRALFNALNGADFSDLDGYQEDVINEFIWNSHYSGTAAASSLMSGDALTAFPVAAQGASSRFNQRILSQAANGVTPDAEDYAAANRASRLVYNGTRFSSLLAQSDAAARSEAQAAAAARRSSIWATIARAKEDTDSDGNGPGFDVRATEYQVGYNRKISDRTVAGISIGKSDADINIDDRSAKGDLDTTSIAAYFRHDNDDLYFSGLLSYSRHNIDADRWVSPGVSVDADYDARTIGLWGEVGKKMERGSLKIEPHISLRLSNTKQDAFSEDGFGGLDVDSEKYNTRRLGLGIRLASNSTTAKFRPYGFVGYEREFGDEQAELTSSVAGLSSFNVKGSQLGKNIWALRLGADARINDRFSVVGEIGASWRKNQDSRYVYGGVKYGW